jgi:hypothetical protein
MNPIVLQSLIVSIQDAIEQRLVNANSAMALIGKGMELMGYFENLSGSEKKKYLIKAIEVIARGKDGVFGTDDDLIPESTAKTLTMLLEQNLVEDAVQLISDAAKGKLNIDQVHKVGQGCFTVCSTLFAPKNNAKVEVTAVVKHG